MFEKEAEEYADKDFGMYTPTDHERYAKETDWKNGAEFGYNKANEEMQEQGLALQSDMDKTIEQNNWLEGCKLELAEHLGKANDRISELEQQIEKMKCCQNCRKFNNLSYDCTCAEVCNEWEIKENE